MAPTPLFTKRVNLEIVFWDLTILLITIARDILRAMPSRLPFDKQLLTMLLGWMMWIVAGLSSGWILGILSR